MSSFLVVLITLFKAYKNIYCTMVGNQIYVIYNICYINTLLININNYNNINNIINLTTTTIIIVKKIISIINDNNIVNI